MLRTAIQKTKACNKSIMIHFVDSPGIFRTFLKISNPLSEGTRPTAKDKLQYSTNPSRETQPQQIVSESVAFPCHVVTPAWQRSSGARPTGEFGVLYRRRPTDRRCAAAAARGRSGRQVLSWSSGVTLSDDISAGGAAGWPAGACHGFFSPHLSVHLVPPPRD